MSDENTGLALREHLEHVLAGVQPDPMLAQHVRSQHRRRVRRYQAGIATGSALAVAGIVAATMWIGSATGSGTVVHPMPLASEGSPTPTPTAAPSYPPAEPQKFADGHYPLPPPTGEILRFPLRSEPNDPPGSQRTLMVWHNADTNDYCADSTVQTPEHPTGGGGGSAGGGCAGTTSPDEHLLSGLVLASPACGDESWSFIFGVLGRNAVKVTAEGVGGPDPEVVTRRLDGWDMSVFLVLDAEAPTVVFHYLDADGHEVRHQTQGHGAATGNGNVCDGPIGTTR